MAETVAQRIRRRRKAALDRCLRLRALIDEGDREIDGYLISADDTRAVLRQNQIILLRLRIWRTTGHYPPDN